MKTKLQLFPTYNNSGKQIGLNLMRLSDYPAFILGELLLALIQAGNYMRHLECTFSEYLKRYKDADGKSEAEKVLGRSKEFASEMSNESHSQSGK